jgi:hypothetical protein
MDPNYTAAAPEKVIARFDVSTEKEPSKSTKKEESQASAPAESKSPEPKSNAASTTVQATSEPAIDAQLAKLIGNMSPEKAKIVESALNR